MIRPDQLEYLQEYFATENNCNRFHPGYKLWSYTHVDGPGFRATTTETYTDFGNQAQPKG